MWMLSSDFLLYALHNIEFNYYCDEEPDNLDKSGCFPSLFLFFLGMNLGTMSADIDKDRTSPSQSICGLLSIQRKSNQEFICKIWSSYRRKVLIKRMLCKMWVARLYNAFIYLLQRVHNKVFEKYMLNYYFQCEVIHKPKPLFTTYRQRANQMIQEGFGGISMWVTDGIAVSAP